MMRKISINHIFLLAMLLFLIVFIIDVAALFNIYVVAANPARNILVMAGMIFFVVGQIKWSAHLPIFNKIKIIFVSFFFIFIINCFLPTDIFSTKSIKSLVYFTSTSLLSLFLLMFVIALIRELIFVQRRKATSRNFLWLFMLLIGFSFFAKTTDLGFDLKMSIPAALKVSGWQDFPTWLFTILLLYFIVINSFRTEWVKFINKNEKLKALFYSLALVVLMILWKAKGSILVTHYNVIAANFFYMGNVFIAVYFIISMLVILLHLPTAGLYDRRVKELSSLYNLSRYMVGVFDINQVKQIITDQTIEIVGANYCWLLVKNQVSQQFELGASNNLPLSFSESFIQNPMNELTAWISDKKMPLKIDRLGKSKLTSKMTLWQNSNGSLLGIPLISNEEIVGILFAVKSDEYGFMTDDQALLTMFANHATLAIENANLIKRSLEREKYEQELKVAHEAQRKLLPDKMPEIKYVQIDAICKTANEVGGDYYDFIYYDESKLGVIIGDVSGKGAEAAFYMAEVKGVIESLGSIHSSPKDLLIQTNKILYQTLDSKTFISALFGVFDFSKKLFTFCRAGHCPLLYWSNKKNDIYLIEPPGLALGLDSGKHFEKNLAEETIQLNAEDIFIFFTDGINEARDDHQQEFEEQRLCDILYEHHHQTASAIKNIIIDKIENFVGGHKQHDDMTTVVIKVL